MYLFCVFYSLHLVQFDYAILTSVLLQTTPWLHTVFGKGNKLLPGFKYETI